MPYAHPVKEAYTKVSTSINSVPRNASDLVGGPLENATKISGRFKLDGGPANGMQADGRSPQMH
jgi:filamentous hemagglutinin